MGVIPEHLPLSVGFVVDVQVVNHYLSCLLPSQHAMVLEKLRYAMPNNAELGLRFVLEPPTCCLREEPWLLCKGEMTNGLYVPVSYYS